MKELIILDYNAYSMETIAIVKAFKWLKVNYIEPCIDEDGKEYFKDLEENEDLTRDETLELLYDVIVDFDDLKEMNLTKEEHAYLFNELDNIVEDYFKRVVGEAYES